MHLNPAILFIPVFLLTSLCATASGPTAAKSLLDIYLMAKQHDIDVQIAESKYNTQILIRPIARANLLPHASITAQTSDNRLESDGQTFGIPGRTVDFNSHGYKLNVRQALYHRDFYVQLRQAKNSVAKAKIDLDAAHQALIMRTASAYFDVLAAQDIVTLREFEKKAIKRQLQQAKEHFEVGLIAITDVHEAQASYDLAVVEEIEAVNALEISKDALEVIVAQRPNRLHPLSDRMELVTPAPNDPEDWVAKALQQNLVLLSSEYSNKIAQQEIKLQRSRHLPTLDLVASYSDEDTGGLSGARSTEDTLIGLQLNIPIAEGGRTYYTTRQARHKAAVVQNEHEKVRRTTIRDARDTYLNVISAISRVKALATALESTEAATRATEAEFQAGTRTSVDVLLAVQETFLAKRNYLRARYDYLLNTLRLKQATGTLSVDDLAKIDDWLN
ncbi:MAG: TolC family outer membrane protein [Gammaproteobacteria bacterium]|nr:TolC family outer membrane protein [Gammaproteobacteria bacterium]